MQQHAFCAPRKLDEEFGFGPLVDVLQYELRDAGGGGKTFVYDEAQRAMGVVAKRMKS